MKRLAAGVAGCLWLGLAAVPGADSARELLEAAAQGRTAKVQELVGTGAALESRDKDERTPLMLAAQHGYADTVRYLLEKGADAAARDRGGATAWVLAMFAPAAHRDSEDVLKLLPPPPRPKLAIEANWSAANLYNSCVMQLEELAKLIQSFQPDLLAVRAIGKYVAASGRSVVEDGGVNARGTERAGDGVFANADAVLILTVKPGAACVAQESADLLNLSLDVQLVRSRDRAVLLHKQIGAGGLKRLQGHMVTGGAQYLPVYQEWIAPYSEQAWREAVEAWFRAE
ncbi:MAG TPA: ankyrin repeat domain-containing protein [Bryobacteraceae bacterium]|nr:ankyrin repeat domain-containing protein [Bryobacteraceae bacterium]